LLPERLRVAQPLVDRAQRAGVELADARRALRARNDKPGRFEQSVSAWKPGSDSLHECDCAKTSAAESGTFLSLFRQVFCVAGIERDSIAIRIEQLKIIVAEKLFLRNRIHRQSLFN